jgi:hypothetical protein
VFLPLESGDNMLNDVINVPNMPLLGAIPNVKNMGFIVQAGFNAILTMTKPHEFHSMEVNKFLFGYRDDFMSLVSKLKWDFNPEDVAILAPRSGISKQRITVNRGMRNVNNVGNVMIVNGKEREDIWDEEKCNEISGSDGLFYGPDKISQKQNVLVYLPELCRSLPLSFDQKVKYLFIFF